MTTHAQERSHADTGVNLAGVDLGNADVDPEGLVGARGRVWGGIEDIPNPNIGERV